MQTKIETLQNDLWNTLTNDKVKVNDEANITTTAENRVEQSTLEPANIDSEEQQTPLPRSTDSRRKREVSSKSITCYKCKLPGHYRKECPQASKTRTKDKKEPEEQKLRLQVRKLKSRLKQQTSKLVT